MMKSIQLRIAILAVHMLFAASLSAQFELWYARLADKHGSAMTTVKLTITDPAGNGDTLQIMAADLLKSVFAGTWPASNFKVTTTTASGFTSSKERKLSDDELVRFAEELRKELKAIEEGATKKRTLEDAFGADIKSIVGAGQQSAILYAMADVLVDRLKEELALKYFDRVAKKMDRTALFMGVCKAGPDTIRVCTFTELMPSTQLLFKESRSHISPQLGATMKAAFVNDLENFPARFAEAYSSGLKKWTDPSCGLQLDEAHFIGLMVTTLYGSIQEQQSLTAILEDLTALPAGPGDWPMRSAALDLGMQLIKSLNEPGGRSMVAIDPRTLSPEALNAYFFFLATNAQIRRDHKILGLKKYDGLAAQLPAIAKELLLTAQAIERMNTAPDITEGKKLRTYGADLKAVIEHADNAAILIITAWGGDPKKVTIPSKLFDFYDAIIECTAALLDTNYGQASLAVLKLVNTVLPENVAIDDDLVKLVTLAADLAEAEKGEVREIFEAAILPVGSYRIKQSTSVSVSINAYAGLSGGMEFLADSSSSKVFGGVHAPIGVNLSWSRGSEKHLRASHSIMLGLIDLGTLVSYRFGGEDSVATAPEITFDQVFAPGLYYVHGFRESPVSVGVGAQYAPRLRSIVDHQANVFTSDAIRVGVFVAVDIPFFHLSLKRGSYDWVKRKNARLELRSTLATDPRRKARLQRKADDVLNW